MIREATLEDLDGILAVESAAEREGDASLWLPGVLDDPERTTLVAVERDRVLGWAKTHHHRETDGIASAGQYLGGVTVHPDHRRRGIAWRLTLARCEWLSERTDVAHCIVAATNTSSLLLHRRLGFTTVAEAGSFHGTSFACGSGHLLRSALPLRPFP